MSAYAFLSKHLPPRLAETLAALYYGALIVLAWSFTGTFFNVFRYANF